MENFGIDIKVAVVSRSQDIPLFEVCESVFDKNPAKFGHENICYTV